MPLDALHLYAVTEALNRTLSEGRIDKIAMPRQNDVLLSVRARGINRKLMLSADPAKPRVWLTPLEYVNPAVAPAFCMHLRKYLTGGKIRSIRSTPYERVVRIEVLTRSELGDERIMTLVVEIMGRYSNLLLVDDRGKITDCLKHTPFESDTPRPVLPGLAYAPCPQEDKFDATDEAKLDALLRTYESGDLSSHLLTKLSGLASFSLKLMLGDLHAGGPLDESQIREAKRRIRTAYERVIREEYQPVAVLKNGRVTEFTVLPFSGDCKATETVLEAEEAYFSEIDAESLWQAAVSAPTAALRNAIKKLNKRIATLDEKITESAEAERYRLYGELLTANLYRVPPRVSTFETENWYDGTLVKIPLVAAKSAVANANAYYKKYGKLKRAADIAVDLKQQAQDEKEYLESVLASLATCTTYDDAEGVKQELEGIGLLRRPTVKGKKQPLKNKPIETSAEGYRIVIGKNNLQNDELTFRTAKSSDVWFHVLHEHGSHVVVFNPNGAELPDSVITAAASLAAYYSAARASDKVAVDYTKIKYVTHNTGKGLGNVRYTHQRTIYVRPSPATEAKRND